MMTIVNIMVTMKVYQSSGAGGTRSLPETLHRLQKLTARLIQNGLRDLEKCQALGEWTIWSTFAK